MFNISISLSETKTNFGPVLFSGDLNQGLKNVSALGYNGVELSLRDSEKIDQFWLLDKLKELNLEVYSLATGQSYYNDGYSLCNPEENSRLRAIERMKRHIDLASKLGSMVIIGGIRGGIELTANRDDLEIKGKLGILKCLKYAKKKNVVILLEPINRYETNFINTLREGIEIIDELGFENLKLLPDTFHMNIEEQSIEDSIEEAREYIGYIHFADSNRFAPGFGHINFNSIISRLYNINYKNVIGIEVLPKPSDYLAAKQAIEFLKGII